MKNLLLISLLMLCNQIIAQVNFQFDLFTDYYIVESENQNADKKEVILSNSLNKFLSLKIYVNNEGKHFAILIDSKQNKSHYFGVVENQTSKFSNEDFKYDYSVSWPKSACFQNDHTYAVTEQDSTLTYNMKINSFIDGEKSAILFLKTKNTNFNFSNNFRFGYLHHFDNCEKLPLQSTILVEQAEFKTLKGAIVQKIKLINYGATILKITINNLKYINSNEHFLRKKYFID